MAVFLSDPLAYFQNFEKNYKYVVKIVFAVYDNKVFAF